LLAGLPEGEPNPSIDSLLHALDQTQVPQDRAIIFQGLVSMHRDAGRIDLAAVYAGALADEQPELRNHIVAGALFRNAGFLQHLQQDSVQFRKFSDEALRHLRSAETLDPNSEDALLELGLAMAESRLPNLGMEGVMKIRKVTEINPKNVEALYRLGVFSMDTKQFDKAENRFRQVLEIDPANHSAKFLLAMTCKELGKNAEFESLLRAVASQKEDSELAERAKSILNQP
jgi:cytochrome c-type biogenesis protein CcmH/NrfG